MKNFAWTSLGERARHVIVAATIALILGASTLLEPIDRLVWLMESRIDPKPVSGEIVFVATEPGFANAQSPEDRIALAKTLRGLKEAGADRVFLDLVIEKPSTDYADDQLAQAVSELGPDLGLTVRLENVAGGEPRLVRSIPKISKNSREYWSGASVDFSGYAWEINPYRTINGMDFPALSIGLAGQESSQQEPFSVDYNFDPSTMPVTALTNVATAQSSVPELVGRTVVIGEEATPANEAPIPGYISLPRSYVQIFAAETLKSGIFNMAPWWLLLAIYSAVLGSVAFLSNSTKVRRVGYLTVVLSLIPFIAVSSQYGGAPVLAPVFALLVSYSLLRQWALRKLRQRLHDDALDMPTFRAMERDLATSKKVSSTAVIVAKIHRFDEVTSTLGPRGVAEYVRQIANRFKIADQNLTVYTSGGKYLGWLAEAPDVPMLESHLRGLRAIFAHPLLIHGTAVDVGITFAADATSESDAARKLAAANSTLERTTEAHEPVLLAEQASDGDLWWSISLQAKIDKALEEGHIFPVFQPQLDLRSGAIIGGEALVRWKDPERGLISPSYFIEQCEHAGRMDHLTQHVLKEAIDAAQEFAREQPGFSISINISATLLRDFRVTDMVERVLAETGYNPRQLVLEITETARISDYDVSQSVMERLRLLGIRLSIDDFGVGAASLETLLRLPFDELKIDRAFISRVGTDPKARAIAKLLVELGNQTGIAVIAEGVEDEESLMILRATGCKTVQGYSIAHPLARDKFLSFQRSNSRNLERTAAKG